MNYKYSKENFDKLVECASDISKYFKRHEPDCSDFDHAELWGYYDNLIEKTRKTLAEVSEEESEG